MRARSLFWTSTSPGLGLGVGLQPLVVVVHRDGDLALGLILADDVLVEVPLDLDGGGEAGCCPRTPAWTAGVLADDVEAEPDALRADVDVRPRDDLVDLALRLVAEGARQTAGVVVFAHRHSGAWAGHPPTIDHTIGSRAARGQG
jgi:hypothetical protein